MNVSDNLTWYQEEWGGGCHSLLPCTSKGCFRTGVPCYCLLWCDFVTFAIFNRRGSSSWKTILWTSWSIWAGFVRVSILNQVFFLDKKLKKTHRSHEIYLFTVLSFVIREWHVQSTYPVRQNFNEWRYSSDFLALETRLSNECRRQFSILLHSYCLTLRLV